MNGVYLRYIDVPNDILSTLTRVDTYRGSEALSDISVSRLQNPSPITTNYATFEIDYWKLDGTFRGITGESALFWNREASTGTEQYVYVDASSFSDATLILKNYGESGFNSPPQIYREWSTYQTSPGVYFLFKAPDFCSKLKIVWRRDSTVLDEQIFYPTSPSYFCANTVELFNSMTITFLAMNRRYRFVKVVELSDGRVLEFTNKELRSLHVLEEVDPTSDTLPINVMNVEFSHKVDDLELVFQAKQVMELYFDDVFYGKFFIDSSESKYSVTATDYIGLLDKVKFKGNFYENETVENIISEILDGEEYLTYTLPSSIASQRLTGAIEPCTKREALAMVLFPLMCYADDSRSLSLAIQQNSYSSPTQYVPKNKTFLNGRNNLYESPVTEVDLTIHDYVLSESTQELLSATLEAGTYTIEFNNPVDVTTVTISGATATELTATYCEISVASAGEVTISANVYEDNEIVISKENTLVASGTPSNVIRYSDKTLLKSKSAEYLDELLTSLVAYNSHATSKYASKVKAKNTIHSVVGIYPNMTDAAKVGVAVKFDYYLRRSQIGTLTIIPNYEGNE